MNQKVGGKGQHSPSFPVKGRLSSSIRFYKILKHYNKSRLKSDFVGKQLKTWSHTDSTTYTDLTAFCIIHGGGGLNTLFRIFLRSRIRSHLPLWQRKTNQNDSSKSLLLVVLLRDFPSQQSKTWSPAIEGILTPDWPFFFTFFPFSSCLPSQGLVLTHMELGGLSRTSVTMAAAYKNILSCATVWGRSVAYMVTWVGRLPPSLFSEGGL